MLAFPSVAPFRLDQVTAAPLLMAGLFAAQLALATALAWAGVRQRAAFWWIAALALVALVGLFFTLGSWGNSDTTKLSYYFSFDLSRVKGEAFWVLVAPWVVRLPYRMSAVHGLVVASYALAPLLLAWHWRALAWAGWWSLLLCCSPLLRNFLQNGVSRQALATLLLVPLLLWAGRLAPLRRRWAALAALLSLTMHTAFAGSLALALLPRLALLRPQMPLRPRLLRPAGVVALLALGAGLVLLVGLALPTALEKLGSYIQQESYFNKYPLDQAVGRLQAAMLLGVLLTCWWRRLSWRTLLRCGVTRQLILFGLLYHLMQWSVQAVWFPQITSRLADVVGLFLLVVYLAWLNRYQCHWAVLPALFVTLDYWLMERLLPSRQLTCGLDDNFLCIPDRWPWQIRYWDLPSR